MSRSGTGPRFTVHEGRESDVVWIYDDDFGFDASIMLTGDFMPEDKIRYAQAVCDALNAADIPVRDDSETGAKHGS